MQTGTAIFLIAILAVAIFFAPTVFSFISEVLADLWDWIETGWDWWPDNGNGNGNQTNGEPPPNGGSGSLTDAKLSVGMTVYYSDNTFSVFATDMKDDVPSYWWPLTIYSDITGKEITRVDVNVMVKIDYMGTVDRLEYNGKLTIGCDSVVMDTITVDGVTQAQPSGHIYICKKAWGMSDDYTVSYSGNTIEHWVLTKVPRPSVPEEADWPYEDTYGNPYLHGVGARVDDFELKVVFGDDTSEVRHQGEMASDMVYCDLSFNMARDVAMTVLDCEVFSVPLS